MSVAARLEANSIPEPNSGCRLWVGQYNVNGYGRISVRGKKTGAHRAAYEVAHGAIPTGKDVCHKCDVRGCVNPDHLWLGSRADNLADMRAKGRQNRGERNAHAKLTADAVMNIRKDHRSAAKVAKDHGVSVHQVHHIRTGRSWRHLEGAV